MPLTLKELSVTHSNTLIKSFKRRIRKDSIKEIAFLNTPISLPISSGMAFVNNGVVIRFIKGYSYRKDYGLVIYKEFIDSIKFKSRIYRTFKDRYNKQLKLTIKDLAEE